MTYARDVAALARKDLLLELRARETLPAMLLFVLATLVAFRFALPSDASERASIGLLWVAILFTALLGITRAFIPEREQRVLDGLVLSPVDRSAIWLGKVVATLAFLGAAELVALPAFALFFDSHQLDHRRGGRPRRHRDLRRGRDSRRDGRGGPRAGAALPGPLPSPVDPDPRRRGGCRRGDDPARYLAFLALYDAVFAILAWASFEYVVTE